MAILSCLGYAQKKKKRHFCYVELLNCSFPVAFPSNTPYWCRSTKIVVEFPSLEVFKGWLDMALGNQV